MQGDFCEPLTSSLMFLESVLLNKNLEQKVRKIIIIVVSQINLMLSSINDINDLQLIESNSFYPKTKSFSLQDTFKFITSMFAT